MASEMGSMKASQSEERMPHLEDILSKTRSHRAGIGFIHEHISAVLARAFGEPEAEPGGKSSQLRPVRSGTVGAIHDAQDDVAEKINEISAMLARLETLI